MDSDGPKAALAGGGTRRARGVCLSWPAPALDWRASARRRWRRPGVGTGGGARRARGVGRGRHNVLRTTAKDVPAVDITTASDSLAILGAFSFSLFARRPWLGAVWASPAPRPY